MCHRKKTLKVVERYFVGRRLYSPVRRLLLFLCDVSCFVSLFSVPSSPPLLHLVASFSDDVRAAYTTLWWPRAGECYTIAADLYIVFI